MKRKTLVRQHPLAELIYASLWNIEAKGADEQREMVRRAANAAVQWHDARIDAIRDILPKATFDGRYGITANELHQRVIEAMRSLCERMDWPVQDILCSHDHRALEQTIVMVLCAIHQYGIDHRSEP